MRTKNMINQGRPRSFAPLPQAALLCFHSPFLAPQIPELSEEARLTIKFSELKIKAMYINF